MTRFVCLLLCLLLGAWMRGGGSSVPTYYVSNTGSDSNNGTSTSTPWQTLAKVSASTFSCGSSVLFQAGGIWREHLVIPSSGCNGRPITFSSYGSGTPPTFYNSIAEGSVGNWTNQSGNLWYATNAQFANDVGSISYGNPATTILTNKVSSLIGLTTQGQFYSDMADSRVYVYSTSNPATFYPGGIEVWWGGPANGQSNQIVVANGINNIIFENINLQFAGFNGLEISNAHHWIIQNINASYIGGGYYTGTTRAGLAVQVNEGSSDITINQLNSLEIINQGVGIENGNSTGNVTNVLIENSVLDKSAQAGIELANSSTSAFSISGVTIKNTTIKNSGMGQWGVIEGSPGSDGVHIYFNGAGEGSISGVSIVGCLITGNQGDGVQAEDGAADITVSYSVISNNGMDGFRGAWFDNPNAGQMVAYGNLIYGNTGNGLYTTNGSGAGYTFVNNTVLGNGTDASSTYNLNIQNFLSGATRIIKNNILYGVNSLAYFDEFGSFSSTNTNNNDYYRASGNLISFGGTTYSTAQFAAYKSASGQDANGFYGDPLLTDASGNFSLPSDFTLQSGSPAIGTGATLTAPYNVGLGVGSVWPGAVITKSQTSPAEIGGYVFP